jgi:hypothetical protein
MHNVGQQRASEGPAEGQQRAINKEEKETYNNESSLNEDSMSSLGSTVSDKVIDYQAFMKFFNNAVEGKGIPQILKITKNRQGLLNARAKEFGKDAIATVVRKAAASSWLNGGGGNFVAKFDWLFRPSNFIKVLEGNYDDKSTDIQTSSEVSSTPFVQSNFKFSSYDEYRNNEQQKRLDTYAEAVDEILNRG